MDVQHGYILIHHNNGETINSYVVPPDIHYQRLQTESLGRRECLYCEVSLINFHLCLRLSPILRSIRHRASFHLSLYQPSNIHQGHHGMQCRTWCCCVVFAYTLGVEIATVRTEEDFRVCSLSSRWSVSLNPRNKACSVYCGWHGRRACIAGIMRIVTTGELQKEDLTGKNSFLIVLRS